MSNSLKQVQKIGLDLLKEFINICEKENIKYYAIAGTLLGAIRHNGFIPWDDDIDVALPREDYEKFLKVCKKYLPDNLRIVNCDENPNYLYYYSKLENLNYKVVDAIHKDETTYIGIDIFAIDGSPNNKLLRKLHFYRIFYHHALVTMCNINILKNRDRGTLENIIVSTLKLISKIMPFNKLTSSYKQKKKIDNLLSKYSIDSSDIVGPLMAGYREREMVPRDCLGKYTKHCFEDIQIEIPEDYDTFLKCIYGDYMKLPEDKSAIQHYSEIIM